MDERTKRYAGTLARLIRVETVSRAYGENPEKFQAFRALLREVFLRLFWAFGWTGGLFCATMDAA